MKGNVAQKYYSVIGICILIGVFFHWSYISEYPSYIHAWAQADHYSITLGFLDNGLNFFKPQTLMYNHQFPDWWTTTTETGITSVDFPLHHYIPAIIMNVLGTHSPIISRLYIFLYSLVGLLGVYKLVYLFSKNYLRALFVVLFAATSPVFIYYQAGFFPSIPSLANTILGIYFYFNYLQFSKRKHFHISIILLTLAALSRTTFIIPLIAIFSNEFLRIIYKKTDWKSKLLPLIISIGTIVGYFFYNVYLRETYSSIFIGYLLPPESLLDLWNVMKEVYVNWFWQYLSIYQYGFLFLLLVGLLINRAKIKTPNFVNWVLIFVLILLFGLLLFTIAMSHAYIYHDYYFLDTFYLPVIILVSLGCSYFPKINKTIWQYVSFSMAGLVILMFCKGAYDNQLKRRTYNEYDMATFTKVSYEGSEDFLTELGVLLEDKILAIDICAPNLPFVMMGRRGHGIYKPTEENIVSAFKWDFDYVVTQNGYFLDRTYANYPDILNHLTVIGNNGRITVSKYHKESKKQSLEQYLFNGQLKPFYSKVCDYEQEADEIWSNVNKKDTLENGNLVGELKPKEIYGITLKEQNLKEFTEKSCMLKLTAKVLIRKNIQSKIALDLKEQGAARLVKLFELSEYIDENKLGTWQNIEIITMLPVLNSLNNNVLLFLWNPEKDHLLVDDFKVEFY